MANSGSADKGPAGPASARGDAARDETDDLIASNKVEGTAVYNQQGEKLGSVYNFMVGKRSGKVAYAVMSFGGFMGLGESFYPLPWEVLTYDTGRGGYLVDLDRERLTKAPTYGPGDEPFAERGYGERVSNFYGIAYGGI